MQSDIRKSEKGGNTAYLNVGIWYDADQVLPPIEELTRSWYLLTHPDLRKTPRVAAFVDHLLDDIPALRTALIG